MNHMPQSGHSCEFAVFVAGRCSLGVELPAAEPTVIGLCALLLVLQGASLPQRVHNKIMLFSRHVRRMSSGQ